MANTGLSRTFGTPTNNLKWTFSAWIKRSNVTTTQNIFSARIDGSNFGMISINSSGYLDVASYIGGWEMRYVTNRVFRDTSAWYHIFVSNDSSLASPETKIYINGVLETSFSTSDPASQNEESMINKSGVAHWVGQNGNNQSYFDGSMSHIHFTDGYVYDATAFGEYDANGVWKIKTSPSVTYGTNGFTILKDGNSVTDQSTNTNNFTVGGGTLTNTEDSPSNVFATFNPLDVNKGTVTTFSNGNTTVMHNAGNNGAVTGARSTLAYSAGKFYWETKCIATGGDVRTGIISMSSSDYVNNTNPYSNNECYTYKQNAIKGSSGQTDVAYGATYTAGDIIGIAHDVSAGTLTFYKNGVSQGVAFTGLSTSLFWGAFSSEYNQGKLSYNFGNGYFGTTAVASAGTNASGIGIFEYDVPTGYTALSTKGLNL